MAGVGLVSTGAPGAARKAATGWRSLFEAPFRYLATTVALVALYYGAARFGFALRFAGPVAAITWLPVGVGIAFLYLRGLQFWPGVVIGDLLANNYSALPFGTALGQTFGNLLEVVVATILLHRLVRRGSPLATVGGVGRMIIAIAVGTALSATIGSLSLLLGHVITAHQVPKVWRTWWLGDCTGAMLVVPLALAWFRPLQPNLWRARRVEDGLGFAVIVGLSALSFYSDRPLTYLVFPGLIWSALRLRQQGATVAVALSAGFAVWATTHYAGPFLSHSLTRSVLETQLYIAVASFSTLCLAAVVTERERFAERLWASRARLVEAADAERRRLERDIHDGAQQRVTALMVRLRLGAERARKDPERAQPLFDATERELAVIIAELRELGQGRYPPLLAQQGLAAAIAGVAHNCPIPIKVVEVPSSKLPEAPEATAYYVLAEAVTNVQKHAQASSIRLRAAVSHGALQLEIVDDGVGGATETGGSGLQGLRDRVEALGGTFEVDTIVGHGTRVAAEIPIDPPVAGGGNGLIRSG
jgi:signal transduction histidine kinase